MIYNEDNHRESTLNNSMDLALQLRDAYNTLSPFIEKHTSIVCPECEEVCCIDKHSHYDKNDLIYLRALGAEVYLNPPYREETGPCRYMSEKGCSRERWERPFRCTYFFCNPLLKSLENDSAKLYRAFLDYFQYVISVRQKLLE